MRALPHFYSYDIITIDNTLVENVMIFANNDYKAYQMINKYIEHNFNEACCEFAFRFRGETW